MTGYRFVIDFGVYTPKFDVYINYVVTLSNFNEIYIVSCTTRYRSLNPGKNFLNE